MPGALEGIRVLELTRVAPGALCAMMLGDLGAEVIKVETPDAARGRNNNSSTTSPDKNARRASNFTNRNKRSIALNLKAEPARAVLRELVKSADVLIEGFRPGVMKRLGADFETLSAVNPRLVYCSMSAFGQDGPYKGLPGHDISYLAFGGTLDRIARPGHLSHVALKIMGDYAAATLHAVVGIMAALMARAKTARGQVVDISSLDGVVALTAAVPGLWDVMIGERAPIDDGVYNGTYPYYGCYTTKDGKMIVLGNFEFRLWENFCRAIGREDLVRLHHRRDHALRAPDEETAAAVEELRTLFITKTRDEWFHLLKDEDVCVAKVRSLDEVLEDPQVRHRNMLIEVEHPIDGKVKQIGTAIKLSDTPASIRRLSPYLGEHTEEILRELGYAPTEISRMQEIGIVA